MSDVTCPYCAEEFEVCTDDGMNCEDGGTQVTKTAENFSSTPASNADESLVERVADAIMCSYLGVKDFPTYKPDETKKSEQYWQCIKYACAAIAAINPDRIRAEARREALEEAAGVCDDLTSELDGNGWAGAGLGSHKCSKAIRALIKKEESDVSHA